MESHGIDVDDTLDPKIVSIGDRFFRGTFDEEAKTYKVELFSRDENENYIANRIVVGDSGETSDWGEHLKHDLWCRKYPCCSVWTPNPPMQPFDTEIPELRKGLRATQVRLALL